MYRRFFAHFILISFAVYLAVSVVTALLSWGAGTIGAFVGVIFSLFGTFVLVFLILIAAEIVLSVILLALPYGWRSFISNVVSGTLVAPFTSTVVTLIYYRLTAAHREAAESGTPAYGTPGYDTPGGPDYGGQV